MKEYYDKYKGKIEIVSYDFCHLFRHIISVT